MLPHIFHSAATTPKIYNFKDRTLFCLPRVLHFSAHCFSDPSYVYACTWLLNVNLICPYLRQDIDFWSLRWSSRIHICQGIAICSYLDSKQFQCSMPNSNQTSKIFQKLDFTVQYWQRIIYLFIHQSLHCTFQFSMRETFLYVVPWTNRLSFTLRCENLRFRCIHVGKHIDGQR